MRSEPVILVCQRADSPLAVRGSSYHRRCRTCDQVVMVAPSGERLIAAGKVAGIVCHVCGFKDIREKKVKCAGTAATPEERRHEMKATIPNYYRRRN